MERHAEFRRLMDDLDEQIVDLLDQRISIAKEIAKEKDTVVDLKRESEIIGRLCSRNYKNLSSQYIRWIYNIIFQIMKEEMRNV